MHPWRLAWKRRHGLWRLVLGLVLVVLLPMVAFQLGKRAETVTEAIANAAPPTPREVTAAVEYRSLEIGEVFRGTVHVDSTPITVADAGVVVHVLLEPNDMVSEGDALAVIDDRPLILLEGDLPLLETLDPGATGSWVIQLQGSLARLGFYDRDIDGEYGRGTQAALRELYDSLGFAPPTSADGGQTHGRNSTASPIPLLRDEVVFLPTVPAQVLRIHVERGDVLAANQVILDLVSGTPVVHLPISEPDVARFGIGEEVQIQVTGDDVVGVVTEVARRISDTGAADWRVAIRPIEHLSASLDGVGVKVLVGRALDADSQLVVPVSAVNFDAMEKPYVAVQTADGFHNVYVSAGLEAGGFVTVAPATAGELVEGDRVRVASSEPRP